MSVSYPCYHRDCHSMLIGAWKLYFDILKVLEVQSCRWRTVHILVIAVLSDCCNLISAAVISWWVVTVCVCCVICGRYQSAFHNVDLTSLREAAVQEYFKQPIVVSESLIIRCHYDYSVYLIYKFCSLFYLQNCTSAIFFSDELKISKSKVK